MYLPPFLVQSIVNDHFFRIHAYGGFSVIGDRVTYLEVPHTRCTRKTETLSYPADRVTLP